MKTNLLIILSIVLFIGCTSRSNTNSDDTTATLMENEGVADNNMANNTWDQDKIKEFVDDASAGSMMEVELGKIAQKKAMAQQVRDYGKMMEKDHGDASNKLKTALQTLSLNIPATLDKDHQDKVDNMNKKTGKEFDKEYIDEMVRDHKDDVEDFEDAQKNLPSGELRTWVENTLPVLRQHLIQAETLQEQLKDQK
jgi:putative membrane protein